MLLAFKLSSQDSVPSSKETTAGSCSEVGAMEIPPDEGTRTVPRPVNSPGTKLSRGGFSPEGTDFSKEITS
jgi:hypothetical protein